MIQMCVTAPQHLELETTGQFTVEQAGDESCRCGLLGSPRTLAYKVIIISSPEFLNENGFIIDWQVIRDYFTTTYRVLDPFPSCERIACQACSDIIELLGHRCLALEVTVGSGARAAGMKAVWRRPSENGQLDYSHAARESAEL